MHRAAGSDFQSIWGNSSCRCINHHILLCDPIIHREDWGPSWLGNMDNPHRGFETKANQFIASAIACAHAAMSLQSMSL